jgi:hypothetical protein
VLLCAEERSNTGCADRKTDSARTPPQHAAVENATSLYRASQPEPETLYLDQTAEQILDSVAAFVNEH